MVNLVRSSKKLDGTAGEKVPASVVEMAAESIREGIRTGRFAPGQRLIESDLCEALGASRTSMREAIGRLEAEGLLEVEHQKGARVRRLNSQDARNIYQVREALEGMAARLAAQNVEHGTYKAQLRALEKKFHAENDGSPSVYLEYNDEFHRLIVQMSENSRIVRMVDQLKYASFLLLIQTISSRPAVTKAHDEHDVIIAAILEGDASRAERAMRAHIRRTGDDVVARLGPGFQ
jgi:DNA-binding GntR family transcriptional regulator